MSRIIVCTFLCCLGYVSPALAQGTDWTSKDLEIIIYDAETVERINNPAPPPAPKTHDFPRDLSNLYTVYEKGIPVIINPEPCRPDGMDLRITVINIDNDSGFIVADLHDDKIDDFLEPEKVVLRIRVAAGIEEIKICLPVEEPGQYAVAVYHDENSNRKFDKGFLKIPKEHFGMSNNPSFGLKSPDYSESAIDVTETGADITIKLFSSNDVLTGNR